MTVQRIRHIRVVGTMIDFILLSLMIFLGCSWAQEGQIQPRPEEDQQQQPVPYSTVVQQQINAEQILQTVKDYIREKRKPKGYFILVDNRNKETLQLIFDQLHKEVLFIKNIGYSVCADFHDQTDNEKRYDIDFILLPSGEKVVVKQVRIHRAPVKVKDQWVMKERFSIKENNVKKVPN